MEGDPLAKREPPGRVVHGAPALGERRNELGVIGHVDERVEEVAQDGGRGNRVVVGGIEREHALGQAGGDLAAALGLPGGQARRACQRQAGGAHRQEVATSDVIDSWMLLAHGLFLCEPFGTQKHLRRLGSRAPRPRAPRIAAARLYRTRRAGVRRKLSRPAHQGEQIMGTHRASVDPVGHRSTTCWNAQPERPGKERPMR